MTLYLHELPIPLRALHIWASERNLDSHFDEGLALHHLLGETFGPSILQPFRLMVASHGQAGTLYAYAKANADTLCNHAKNSLLPAHAGVISLDRLRSLPRPASAWTTGQRLGFDLRFRPVVRLASALNGTNESGKAVSFKKGAEIDAFLAAALRDKQKSRETIYIDWLAERLSQAAALDLSVSRLARFQRKSVQRNGRRIEGPDVVVHGTLTITDPIAFAEVLARGVGRHRSYGYGMLLLRPPQRRR